MRYTYECSKCKRVWGEERFVDDRDRVVVCGRERFFGFLSCKGRSVRILFSHDHLPEVGLAFTPAWFHDICEESMYITNKRQLRDECKKHNVIAARLL